MPTLELTDQQVVDLVAQLPPERKRAALLSLAAQAVARRDQRMQTMESQLRQIAAARSLDWDKLSEVERESLIDDLVHEDRPCGT